MMARIGNKLIAICSAAIGIIYTAGYVVSVSPAVDSALTQPAQSIASSGQPIQPEETEHATPQATNTPIIDEYVKSTPLPVTVPPEPAAPTPAIKTPRPIDLPNTPIQASAAPQTIEPTPTSAPLIQHQKYQDGTYSGSGTNRFGTVEVEVKIIKGKIANVDITSSKTRYPQKYIDPLPDEVITAQDYNIDTISGATRSSEDFINAVHEALMQAEGNN
jgi:uncharacterized protein with FMN-binding domain